MTGAAGALAALADPDSRSIPLGAPARHDRHAEGAPETLTKESRRRARSIMLSASTTAFRRAQLAGEVEVAHQIAASLPDAASTGRWRRDGAPATATRQVRSRL
jgi:hypothetical protein